MGHDETSSVADRYGLARGNRERRWTAIVDVTLVLAALAWVVVLRAGSAAPGLRWAVSLVLVAMVTHRVLLVADRRRRRHGRAAPTRGTALGAALENALETAREGAGEPVLDAGATAAPAVTEPGTPAGPQAA
ncbi:MAG: hypothetical protein JWR20_2323 [Marmoricola sp.]|nr:hypothetical protein [Marmoricola sp.]